MIPQSLGKVKRIVGSIVRKGEDVLSLPEQKFCTEMILGMLKTGSCNLTSIAGSLGEDIGVKHTLKRLQRMIEHDVILDQANAITLQAATRKASTETIWALDIGDSVREYGKKFEMAATVKDGNTGLLKKGYWLNQVSGYNPSSKETFPVQLDIFSTMEEGWRSQNAESLGLIDQVVASVGRKGLWAMDRGYDSGTILGHMLEKKLDFIIRMKNSRNVLVGGQSINIHALAEGVNRRVKWSSNARFGSKKVSLNLKGEEYQLTLIVFKDKRNKDVVMWMTNGWIKSTKELKRRIRGYFRRWGVEESYRFEKQGFGIEKSIVRQYKGIRTLIGLTLLSWFTLVRLNEQPKLAKEMIKAARMEKMKGPKSRPAFNYYRLLQGIRNTLALVAKLCFFRCKKRNSADADFSLLHSPLFAKIPQAIWELEYAS